MTERTSFGVSAVRRDIALLSKSMWGGGYGQGDSQSLTSGLREITVSLDRVGDRFDGLPWWTSGLVIATSALVVVIVMYFSR